MCRITSGFVRSLKHPPPFILLQAGANANVLDASRRTPLHMAVRENHVECTELLLQVCRVCCSGADIRVAEHRVP